MCNGARGTHGMGAIAHGAEPCVEGLRMKLLAAL